jgi:hypothetical protein
MSGRTTTNASASASSHNRLRMTAPLPADALPTGISEGCGIVAEHPSPPDCTGDLGSALAEFTGVELKRRR